MPILHNQPLGDVLQGQRQTSITLLRSTQWFLAGDPELSEKRSHRRHAQLHPELVFDQLGDHATRPQREGEIELQWILARHRLINPLHHLAREFWRPPGEGPGLQSIPAATAIPHKPALNGGAIQAENFRDDLRTLAIPHTLHNAYAHFLTGPVIKLPSVIPCH